MPNELWYYVVDGERRGPVSGERLRGLDNVGATTDETLVWTEGMADWVPLRDVRHLLPVQGEDMTNVDLSAPVAPGAPVSVPRETNPLAIASLILAILGVCTCLTVPFAIICGHMALSQIKANPHRYTGRGVALAGLVIAYAFLLLVVLWFMVLFFIGFAA